MFVLDTDHIGIIQRKTKPDYPRLAARMSRHPSSNFYYPIISFHEQALGWHAYIQRARTTAEVADYAVIQVLPFDPAAVAVFDPSEADAFESAPWTFE